MLDGGKCLTSGHSNNNLVGVDELDKVTSAVSPLNLRILACSQRASTASENLDLLQQVFVFFLVSAHWTLRNNRLDFAQDRLVAPSAVGEYRPREEHHCSQC